MTDNEGVDERIQEIVQNKMLVACGASLAGRTTLISSQFTISQIRL